MAKKQNLSYQDIESALTVFKENDVVAGEVGYEILKAFGKGEADIRRYRASGSAFSPVAAVHLGGCRHLPGIAVLLVAGRPG